jgi:hypothetical protein
MHMAPRAGLSLPGRTDDENKVTPLSPPRKAARIRRHVDGGARDTINLDSADVNTSGAMSPSHDDIVLG